LRFFAEKLEEPANKVLGELHHFEAAAGALNQDRGAGSQDISLPLAEALSAIRQVSAKMDADIQEFEREGQEVFTKVSAAIGTLDFESELGEVLDDCVATADELADLAEGDITDLGAVVEGLGSRIYRIYTMASERDVHQAYFPMLAVETASAASATASDEDLFEDALF
jgi:hypothetical protein